MNRWLCILDIKNEQEGYARASQIISTLSQIENGINIEDTELSATFRILRTPFDSQGGRFDAVALEKGLQTASSLKMATIDSWSQFVTGLKRTPGSNEFSYYLRVDLSGSASDLPSLSYLVLLLQTHPSLQTRGAFFLWDNGAASESAQNKQYFRISDFLRFIQSKYHCFFSIFNGMPQSLTTKSQGVQRTFLPLLEIDQDTYWMLRRPWPVEVQFKDQRFADLYKALLPSDGEPNRNAMALFRTGLRALFHNLNGYRYNNADKKRDLLELLAAVINDVKGITPLDALLLGVLVDKDMHNGIDEAQVRNYLANVQLFSGAVSQLLENIVFHSPYSKGVFTWRLQTKADYIQKNYPGYMITKQDCGLELLIADFNCQDSIIEHFLAGNKATPGLLAHRNELALSDLFQETPAGSSAQFWAEARSAHPEVCHGLRSFSHAVNSFGGTFYVRSSPSFLGTALDTYYYKGGTGDSGRTSYIAQHWVPGTQFSAIFARTEFHKKKLPMAEEPTVFDVAHIVYTTTYRDLALALQYDRKAEPLFPNESVCDISRALVKQSGDLKRQEKKDAVVNGWKAWFDRRIAGYQNAEDSKQPDQILLYADLRSFQMSSEDFSGEMESFCKGFFSSGIFQKRWSRPRFLILFHNVSDALSRTLYQTLYVMHRYVDTSGANVYFYQKSEERQENGQARGSSTPYLTATLQELLHKINPEHQEWREGFPRTFPYLLLTEKEPHCTLFESDMKRQAEISILNRDTQGYKIEDTHMRLGNKVHLDVFYEMARFFENPNYAYYTAFLILQRLKSESRFRQAQKILFYGYASYSRGVVWAMIQIWREYMSLQHANQSEGAASMPEIEFVIYQNDLKLESDQAAVQMYYSREEWQRDASSIWEPLDTLLIQIVPISSSLTTFNKMLAEFCLATGKPFQPFANLTAFWVRDDYEKKSVPEDKPTEEEKDFWDCVDIPNKKIRSSALNIEAQYLIYVTSYWRNPLKCEKCFPQDPLLEIPLVETDPTSTIPTQQFYLEPGAMASRQEDGTTAAENDARVAGLRGNILYGHISRGHNHFQYYIQTRRYFLQERTNITNWLRGLSKKIRGGDSGGKHIDVLVIPQQTSNVEFSQIVYEYCFNGEAECIIVNTEKEFRSNFLAEYNGLARRLRQEKARGCQLCFHYIDMSINSGIVFHRAGALIQSLLNQQDILDGQETSLQFDHVFLLISRMSAASKRSYVRDPELGFHAYVELNISNMRSFGDSCVPCKLQQEAGQYFQSAATKATSAFWEKKSILYSSVPFDLSALRASDKLPVYRTAYYKMACAHRASYYVSAARGGGVGDYFQALRGFLTELQNAFRARCIFSPVYQSLADRKDSAYEWFSAALKITARPFFSFDYRLRCAALDLYLLMAEQFLNSNGTGIARSRFQLEKTYLTDDVLVWVASLVKDIEDALAMNGEQEPGQTRLHFIQHVVLKGLADLKSNYILRRETMIRVFCCVAQAKLDDSAKKQFFESYRRSILRLIHNSSDETKSLWLEHLLQFKQEYPKDEPRRAQADPEGFAGVPMELREDFQDFLELLLVENNRPLLQGVRNLCRASSNQTGSNTEELKKYHMRNVCKFINLSHNMTYAADDKAARENLVPLTRLYKLLTAPNEPRRADGNTDKRRLNPLERYNALQSVLQEIVKMSRASGNVSEQVLLFGLQQPEKRSPRQSNYYMISPQPPIDFKEHTKYDGMLKQMEDRLQDHTDELEELGFALLKGDSADRFDVALLLNNNYDQLNELNSLPDSYEYHGQKIEPMYIFFPCHLERERALMLVREILMFRCNLVAWLEQDFNNNAISTLVQQRYWAETLAFDKVGDHGEQDFIECTRRVLCEDGEGEYKDAEDEYKDSRFEVDDAFHGKCRVSLVKADGQEEFRTVDMNPDVLNELRHWHLFCSYVNSRIARLYRTFAQEASHVEYSLSDEYILRKIKTYYARDYLEIGREAAYSLKDVFFAWIEGESSRRNYLAQLLKVVSFTLDGKQDTCQGSKIEDRIAFLRQGLEDYLCIQFSKDNADYGYLAEYLAIIIIDCCISALKVSRTWQKNKFGYEVFLALHDCAPEDKCSVRMYRQHGGEGFDYLVIENDVYPAEHAEAKSGPGMSQTAMCWYIDKLWRFRLDQDPIAPLGRNLPDVPRVELPDGSDGSKYQIKLPILKAKGEK